MCRQGYFPKVIVFSLGLLKVVIFFMVWAIVFHGIIVVSLTCAVVILFIGLPAAGYRCFRMSRPEKSRQFFS